jgi:hypothetical protein
MADPGSTTDPKTGKIYRKTPPKERSAEFVRLSRAAETARMGLVTYCNEKSYIYDIGQGKAFETIQKDGKPKSVWVKDQELVRLTQAMKTAKDAVKQYKTAHPEEFRAQPAGKQARRTTMKVVGKPSVDG